MGPSARACPTASSGNSPAVLIVAVAVIIAATATAAVVLTRASAPVAPISAPTPAPAPAPRVAPVRPSARSVLAASRPVRPRPTYPGAWVLAGPKWTPKPLAARVAWGQRGSNTDVFLHDGYRLFPELLPGYNSVTLTLDPGAQNLPRLTWERGDQYVADKVAGILFAFGEDARSGPLHRALMDGAASFDTVAMSVAGAAGAPYDTQAFFDRLRKENAAYAARMKDLNERGFEAFESGNLVAFAAVIFEGGVALLEGTYEGVKDAFGPSHGGAARLSLTLPWSARDADEYAHRAYLTATVGQ